MATTHLYGPYYVITGPDNKFQPGEVRSFGFGPWPPFADGTATVSANIQDFSALPEGGTRAITIENLEYVFRGNAERFIQFTYRNTGSSAMQGWYFNLSVVVP